MRKRIAILGSTGSIGRQTLDVIACNQDCYEVTVLTAGSRIDVLREQALAVRPRFVAVRDEQAAAVLKQELRAEGIDVLGGEEGIVTAAGDGSSDMVVAAMVGVAGLLPTMAALDSGKQVALANKEVLVAAGELVMQGENRKRLIPVDSEHSAVFQCVHGWSMADVQKIWLTGSGGPFRAWTKEQMQSAGPRDALRHPNWSMGAKISVDSATMMNKGLELIEARWLFDVEWSRLGVVIHPDSIVHSMVEFVDGSFMAQLSPPDMRLPIALALSYPDRRASNWPHLDVSVPLSLTFEPPDEDRFPCLRLARECGMAGGIAPTVMNAANEQAVAMFLHEQIGYGDIYELVRRVVDEHVPSACNDISVIIAADKWARNRVSQIAVCEGGVT